MKIKTMNKQAWIIFSAVIVLALIICGYLFGPGFFKKETPAQGYQAVFLASGQVYFGHLSETHDKFIKLTDIYYLQTKQPLQSQNSAEVLNQSDLSLVKLGNELHGPTDEMYISQGQVLFWENLKPDSKVVQAIEKYRGSK